MPQNLAVGLGVCVQLDVAGLGELFERPLRAFGAEVAPDRVTVLAEKAYNFDDLNAEIVSAELATAESDLAAAKDDAQRFAANEAIALLGKLKAAH